MGEPAIEFSKLIYEARLSKGLTQEVVAQKAGVHRCTLGEYENNRRQPSDLTARKICRALEIEPIKIKRRFEIAIHEPTLTTKFPIKHISSEEFE